MHGLVMGFYGQMFWGFSGMLPQQDIGDAPERAAVFFSLAWVGYLSLIEATLFGGAAIRMLGEEASIVAVVVLGIALYAGHVAYFRPRNSAHETSPAGDGAGVAAVIGLFFVLFGWGSILAAGMLVSSSSST